MSGVDFRISSAQVGERTYVASLGGELDLHVAPQVDEHLVRLLLEHGARRIVVDLGGVTFVDSTILGVLVRTARRLATGGGELVLATDDARILRTLEVTGLDGHLRVHATLLDAVTTASVAAA